jgi:hypothetical protein
MGTRAPFPINSCNADPRHHTIDANDQDRGRNMDTTSVTYGQALRIWWSYLWRLFVLVIPVMIITMIVVLIIMPFPNPGETPPVVRPDQIPGMMAKMTVLWIFMMALNILGQVQAMRWMLKTRWTGFRLQVISDDKQPAK